MPATSASQRRLMQAALHGATFDQAKDVRASMTTTQLHDYAQGPSVAEAIGPAPSRPPKTPPRPPKPHPRPKPRPGY
jgi:hypothetical protein